MKRQVNEGAASITAIAGFALVWLATFIFAYSFVFIPPEVVGTWRASASRVAYLGGIALTQIVLYQLSRRPFKQVPRIPLATASTLLLVITCAGFHLFRGTGADIAFFLVGMCFAGMWQGAAHVLWPEALMYFSSTSSCKMMYGSIALGALLFIISMLSVGDHSPILTVAVAVAAFAFYIGFSRVKPAQELDGHPISRKLAKGLRKSDIALAVYGAVFGVGIYTCMSTDIVSPTTSYASIGVALCIGPALLLVILHATGRRFKLDEMTMALSPVLAFILLALMYAQGAATWVLYLALLLALETFDSTAFCFHLQVTREMALEPFMNIARGRAFAQTGMFIAALAEFAFIYATGAENAYLIPVVMVGFLFVMMSTLGKVDFLPKPLADHPLPEDESGSTDVEVQEEEGRKEEAEAVETDPRAPAIVPAGTPAPHVDIVARIADDYDLSAREVDVLRLLITGHNTESIADRLFISQNTVKSHRYHMYRKLGVNSKQEIINIRDQYYARYKGL